MKHRTIRQQLQHLLQQLSRDAALIYLGLALSGIGVAILSEAVWLGLLLFAAAVIEFVLARRHAKGRNPRMLGSMLPRQPGEVLVTINISGDDPLFPALAPPDDVWITRFIPRFRREVAERVVAWVNATYAAAPDGCSSRAYWDGHTIVVIESQWEDEPGYTPNRVEPDEDGRYSIGDHLWDWEKRDAG